MTSFSLRRLVLACTVSAAAVVAVAAPTTASAATDLGEQCSGSNIKGNGSSFQAPILVKWAVEFNNVEIVNEKGEKELAPNKNPFACGGEQGAKKTPKVEYLSGGSGACLHAWGTEKVETPKFGEIAYCGTDEAPNPTQKAEIESYKVKGEGKSLETIPVLQGAVAVIVHLPSGCKAESEIEKGGKKVKLGRLALDDTTVEGIYAGAIKNWTQLLEHQVADGNSANNKLTCKGGVAEEEKRIIPVVRLDHSGTTHIFKAFLEQVSTTPIEMEEYVEEIGGKKTGCGKALPEESEAWSEVAEACQNQRWPKEAQIVRGTVSGNPGVVARVIEDESSVGYADLAVAREKNAFSAKCTVHPTECGGENTSGTATKVGTQSTKFWAVVQNTATPEVAGYVDPSTDGDTEKAANSNCTGTVYTNNAGEKFPPANTRESWSAAKAELVEARYAICGLTYDLALRQYKYYPGTTKEEATSVENFLLWALNGKAEGGGSLEKNTDYEKLPGAIISKAEAGVKQVGFEKG